jgi:hypothetical protein
MRKRLGTRLAESREWEGQALMGSHSAYARRIVIFTAAFVMLPVGAFALLLGGMVSRRFWGVA